MERPTPEIPDLREKSFSSGQMRFADHRLYVQLQVFTGCRDAQPVVQALAQTELEAVVYADVNDPLGIAVLTLTQDPTVLTTTLRATLTQQVFSALTHRPEFTLFGRTYAVGYEPDLDEVLLHRPRRTAGNAAWPWAVWYPLRRKGTFTLLPEEEQRAILGEHGRIGQAFGAGDFAHDIRLACYGMDTHDNDFVVGLVGKELYPLSACVQAMRKTKQTSQYLEKLGPFFVGHAIWRHVAAAVAK